MPIPTRSSDLLSRTPTYGGAPEAQQFARARRRVINPPSAIADAAGTATVRIDAEREPRFLEALCVHALASAATPTVTIYVGDNLAPLDRSSGTLIPGEYHPPRLISAGAPIIIVWTGLNPGDVASASNVQLAYADGDA